MAASRKEVLQLSDDEIAELRGEELRKNLTAIGFDPENVKKLKVERARLLLANAVSKEKDRGAAGRGDESEFQKPEEKDPMLAVMAMMQEQMAMHQQQLIEQQKQQAEHQKVLIDACVQSQRPGRSELRRDQESAIQEHDRSPTATKPDSTSRHHRRCKKRWI